MMETAKIDELTRLQSVKLDGGSHDLKNYLLTDLLHELV